MRNRHMLILFGILGVCVGRAHGAFDEAEWRKTYDDPRMREVAERWLDPRPSLEREVREEAARTGALPKDAARAEEYVKQFIAFQSGFYSTVYRGTKIDAEASRRILANPDFDKICKGKASLLLYINGGDAGYLKRYLLSSPFAPRLFLRVHDPNVVKPVLEIVAEAYKERLGNLDGPPGKHAMLVAESLPALAGMMYVQDGGRLGIARQLFRDIWLFAGASGPIGVGAPVEAAQTLYEQGPRRALEEFLYAMYENADGQTLANIKRNASPELAEIVDKVGERYSEDVKKVLDQVIVTKPMTKRPTGAILKP